MLLRSRSTTLPNHFRLLYLTYLLRELHTRFLFKIFAPRTHVWFLNFCGQLNLVILPILILENSPPILMSCRKETWDTKDTCIELCDFRCLTWSVILFLNRSLFIGYWFHWWTYLLVYLIWFDSSLFRSYWWAVIGSRMSYSSIFGQ